MCKIKDKSYIVTLFFLFSTDYLISKFDEYYYYYYTNTISIVLDT